MLRTEEIDASHSLYGKAAPLVEGKWKDWMDGIRDNLPDVQDHTLATTAIVLENTYKQYLRMYGNELPVLMEASTTGNIANFIKHGFDIIAAVMPSLIANDVISIQPLTRRKGEIFYLEYLYGTTKGKITAGSKMFARDVAGNAEIWYSHETVPEEQLAQVGGAPSMGPFGGTLLVLPLRPGKVTIVALRNGGTPGVDDLTATDDGNGNLIGDVSAGTINYTTGVVTALTWDATATANAWNLATYMTNFESNPDNIPEVDLSISSASVEAFDRKLKCRYNLDFGFDIKEEFGLNPEQLLSTGMASEIRREIDGELLKFIFDNATAGAPSVFNTTPPSGISYAEHKWTFVDAIIEASNNIFAATRRAVGNFIIAGMDVCTVIESLSPRFKAQGKVQPGPHFIGTLDNRWRVYKNPFYADKQYVVGFKGDQWLEAGSVYAPYMPVFMTRPIMLDDFVNRRGIATSYAKHNVTGLFYSKGSIA